MDFNTVWLITKINRRHFQVIQTGLQHKAFVHLLFYKQKIQNFTAKFTGCMTIEAVHENLRIASKDTQHYLLNFIVLIFCVLNFVYEVKFIGIANS